MVHKLKILPNDIEIEIDETTSLLKALQANNIYIKTICGGFARCGQCIVKIVSGEENINTPSFAELSLIGNVFHITKERLACQTYIYDDVTIDISRHSVDADEETRIKHTKGKGTTKTNVRKKEEVIDLKRKKGEEYQAKLEKEDKWYKHWEKKDAASEGSEENNKKIKSKHKRLGGGKRPRFFKSSSDSDNGEENS